jgi:hypothetical protein
VSSAEESEGEGGDVPASREVFTLDSDDEEGRGGTDDGKGSDSGGETPTNRGTVVISDEEPLADKDAIELDSDGETPTNKEDDSDNEGAPVIELISDDEVAAPGSTEDSDEEAPAIKEREAPAIREVGGEESPANKEAIELVSDEEIRERSEEPLAIESISDDEVSADKEVSESGVFGDEDDEGEVGPLDEGAGVSGLQDEDVQLQEEELGEEGAGEEEEEGEQGSDDDMEDDKKYVYVFFRKLGNQ